VERAVLLDAVFLAVSALVAFLVVLVVEPAWIRVARSRGLVGRDMNKLGAGEVAEAGGVWSIVGAVFGLFVLEALYRYILGHLFYPVTLFAVVEVLLLSGFLGFMDDILGWKKGLPKWQRVVFMAPISLPLVVIKAGQSKMALPLVGVVDLGLLYPLVAVPVGVLGAANAFNMIAGLNGLEAGMGLVLMLTTAAYAWMRHVAFVPEAALIMASAIAGFLVYNRYPARVFPGNSFTYAVGAYYASLTIVGNMEKFALALFAPYFVEFALFLRGLRHGVYKENFGRPQPDGSLLPPYDRVYSLTHAAMRLAARLFGKTTERNTVALLVCTEAAWATVLLLLAAHHLL
jgi:UDP-N-acetylglucosamine--dolichyl-phosphate N-acetylglucosaminephosphotransferase